MQLVRPGPEHLASYIAALEHGWSPDNERGVEAAREELSRIHADAAAFLASMEDREAKGPPITLPDGSPAKRLPAKAVGLPYVEITTDPNNIASQRVIEANGGILVEHFIKPQQFGCKPGLRFRITFT